MSDDSDPFAEFVRPPLHETPSERAARKYREAEEKRVSDAIDEQIKQERQILLKQKTLTKILLLGQSESGKSTTLKNFRLEYARGEWEAEKVSWRAVIQLNLVRSVLSILETVRAEMEGDPLLELDDTDSVDTLDGTDPNPPTQLQLSPDEIQQLQMFEFRLASLRRVEMDLKQKLGAGTEEVTSMDESLDLPPDLVNEVYPEKAPDSRYLVARKTRRRRVQGEEMVVRGLRWREFLSRGRKGSFGRKTRANLDVQDQRVADILAECRDDMKRLWNNHTVRMILEKRRMTMENSAGFFLNDIDRIASSLYLPSDDDIVRSRLRTVGIQEYHIFVPGDNLLGPKREWILYDVGGSRTMRRAWIPFFEDVNAIIFLAPLSCFDETLLEDSSVNRLNDTIGLWKAIVSSKILQNTTMVCFLNKCDILKRKLRDGIQFRNYVRDYGNRPNELLPVIKFVKESIKNIAIKYTVNQRRMTYIYTTSVTDTKATAATLGSVRDSIFRTNLASASLVV